MMIRTVKGANACKDKQFILTTQLLQFTYLMRNIVCLIRKRSRIFVQNYNDKEDVLPKSLTDSF